MRTVHTFRVQVDDLIQLLLPRDSKVLMAEVNQSIAGHLNLWVELDTAKPSVNRQFRVYRSNVEIAKADIHVASFSHGVHVYHLYDAGEEILPLGMARPTLAATKPRRPLGAK